MKPCLPPVLLLILFSSCKQLPLVDNKAANSHKLLTNSLAKSNYKTIVAQNSDWRLYKNHGRIIEFNNHKKFDTKLYDMNYIGQVDNDASLPFLILSGRDCTECDANVSIYVEVPTIAAYSKRTGDVYYAMPGQERDYETNKLLYKARAFYGEVLPGIHGVLWYQHQLRVDSTWDNSLFLVSVVNDRKKESVLKYSGQLTQTLQLVKQKRCKEIKGMNYISEP